MPLEAEGCATDYVKFTTWFRRVAEAFRRFFPMPAKKTAKARFSLRIRLCLSKYALSRLYFYLSISVSVY